MLQLDFCTGLFGAGDAVRGFQGLHHEPVFFIQRNTGLGAIFRLARRLRAVGVIETRVRACPPGTGLQLRVIVADFHAPAGAAALEVGTAAGDFRSGSCLVAQPGSHVDTGQALLVDRVGVANDRGAQGEVRRQLNPGINAGHRVFRSARIDRIAHPDEDRIEIGVHAGHGALEQQLAGVRLQFIVAEGGQRHILDNDRRLVAVAREDVYLLAVDHAVDIQPEWPGRAIGAELFDQLRGGCAAGKTFDGVGAFLDARLDAVQSPCILGQLTRWIVVLGGVVAQQRIAGAVLHHDIEFSGGLGIKTPR